MAQDVTNGGGLRHVAGSRSKLAARRARAQTHTRNVVITGGPPTPSGARSLRLRRWLGERILLTTDFGTRAVFFRKWAIYTRDSVAAGGLALRLQERPAVEELTLDAPSPRFADHSTASPASSSPASARGKRKARAGRHVHFGFHGPEKGRAGGTVTFQSFAREVKPQILKENEMCPELKPLMTAEHSLYGLFSGVDPPEWGQLHLLCSTHPVALPFLGQLHSTVEQLQPGVQLLARAQQHDSAAVPAALVPLLSVVIQLVSFFATYRSNTDLTFNRFASCFAIGGILALGPAVLVALAVSTAATYDAEDDGEERFVECAQQVCHMALLAGQALAAFHLTLPRPARGQSYVLQVHNISRAVLDACLSYINGRADARAPIQISVLLASRSFFLSGYPSDLEALQRLLRSIARRGFKFGTRFLPFSGPILSPLNAPAAKWLKDQFHRCGFRSVFDSNDLRLEVLSPVTGKQLRESTNLLDELADCILLQPHSTMCLHDAVPSHAGVVSFECTNVPNALGGHNLITKQLMLQTPYLRVVSQPFSFTHKNPDMDELHPRNNTKEERRSVLLKCAVINETLAQQGSNERCDLLSSWLELGLLEHRPPEQEQLVSPVFGGFRAFHSPSEAGVSLPSPTTRSAPDTGLRLDLSGADTERIAHQSQLYNAERIEALGEELCLLSPAGKAFLQLLELAAGHRFDEDTLWRCPNVISFIEYWDIVEVLRSYTGSSPITPADPMRASINSDSAYSRGRYSAAGEPLMPINKRQAARQAGRQHSGHSGTSRAAQSSLGHSVGSSRGEGVRVPNFAAARQHREAMRHAQMLNAAAEPPEPSHVAARRRHLRERMRFFYSFV